jgi:integrase
MSRIRQPSVPSYRLHRQSGQGIVTLPDGVGGRRDVLLGKHNSPESIAEYRRLIAEWSVRGRLPAARVATPAATLNEIILSCWQYVASHYRLADGSPSTEVNNIRLALRPLKSLYGHTAAADFDVLALEAVREQMIRDWHCRNRVNKDVARIKRLFKWGARKKLLPISVFQDLATIEGLRAGRSEARDTPPVRPVPRPVVEQTVAVMRPTLADMVCLQLETGMRPGEVCRMRACDIDMTVTVWLYRPGQHKSLHHGHDRVVPIGPRSQEYIRRHLKTDIQAYLFTPADSMAELRAHQRRNRKSKVPPSQRHRAKPRPKRRPGERYTTAAYASAVAGACDRAFPPPQHLRPRQGETKKSCTVVPPRWDIEREKAYCGPSIVRTVAVEIN